MDAVLKDLDDLQGEVYDMKESNSLTELENHLTDRIAALSEYNLKINMTQRETIDGISETAEACKTIVQECIETQKDHITEIREHFEASMA